MDTANSSMGQTAYYYLTPNGQYNWLLDYMQAALDTPKRTDRPEVSITGRQTGSRHRAQDLPQADLLISTRESCLTTEILPLKKWEVHRTEEPEI